MEATLPQSIRPTFDSYAMSIAFATSARSTCPRASVGAVLVKDNRIIATGYNGAPTGIPHCTDEGCLMVKGHCIRTVHAEMNAIIQSARYGVSSLSATLYCTHYPCRRCANSLINAGIVRIVYQHHYGYDTGTSLLLVQAGIRVENGNF